MSEAWVALIGVIIGAGLQSLTQYFFAAANRRDAKRDKGNADREALYRHIFTAVDDIVHRAEHRDEESRRGTDIPALRALLAEVETFAPEEMLRYLSEYITRGMRSVYLGEAQAEYHSARNFAIQQIRTTLKAHDS